MSLKKMPFVRRKASYYAPTMTLLHSTGEVVYMVCSDHAYLLDRSEWTIVPGRNIPMSKEATYLVWTDDEDEVEVSESCCVLF